jgi:hypothetical protein
MFFFLRGLNFTTTPYRASTVCKLKYLWPILGQNRGIWQERITLLTMCLPLRPEGGHHQRGSGGREGGREGGIGGGRVSE